MSVTYVIDTFVSQIDLPQDASRDFASACHNERYVDCIEIMNNSTLLSQDDNISHKSGGCVSGALAWLYYLVGEYDKSRDSITRFHQTPSTEVISIQILEGWLLLCEGKTAAALEHVRAAIKVIKAQGDMGYYSNALFLRGMAHYRIGKLSCSIDDLKSSYSIARVSNDSLVQAGAMNSHGLVLMTLGHYNEASDVLKKTYGICEMTGSSRKLSHVANNLSIVEYKRGNYSTANRYIKKALEFERNVADKSLLSQVSIIQARIDLAIGGLDTAKRRLLNLLDEHVISDARIEPLVLETLGDIAIQESKFESAERYYTRAKNLGEAIAPGGDIVAECLRRLASLRIRFEEYFEAIPLLKEAIEAAEKCGERFEIGIAHRDLSIAYRNQNHFLQALEHSKISVDMFQEMGAKREAAASMLEAAIARHGWYAMRAGSLDLAIHSEDDSPYTHIEEAWSYAIDAHQLFSELDDEAGRNSCEKLMDTMRDQGHPIWLRKKMEGEKKRRVGAEPFIANAPSMRKLLTLVEIAATTREPVLVTGETGTGKELIARMIHDQSDRAGKPFVPVNCAAIPETLFEREFFGHDKGAYTGAEIARSGLCEEADGGTLFLDEIGDMPSYLQVKLLRLLQEGSYRRLGDPVERSVDLRIVAATNAPLPDLIGAGKFRQDLYYRLQTLEMPIPPLRERPEDLDDLMDLFVRQALDDDIPARRIFARGVLNTFRRYPWPGNVRELEAMTRRMALMARHSGQATVDMLPEQLARWRERRVKQSGSLSLTAYLEEAERGRIDQALILKGGNRSEAARALGISRNQLYRKMEKLGIRAPR